MIAYNEEKADYSRWQQDYEQVRANHFKKKCQLCNGVGKVFFQESYYSPFPNGGAIDYPSPPPTVKVTCPYCEGSGYAPIKATWDEVNAPSSEQTQGQNPA